MSEPKPIYETEPSELNQAIEDVLRKAIADNSVYWQKVVEQERRKAADNLRLAAERGSEIADLHKALDEVKTDYVHACKTIADMHAAAVGEITGPKRGVVEDVADVRKALDEVRIEITRLRNIITTLNEEVEDKAGEITRLKQPAGIGAQR